MRRSYLPCSTIAVPCIIAVPCSKTVPCSIAVHYSIIAVLHIMARVTRIAIIVMIGLSHDEIVIVKNVFRCDTRDVNGSPVSPGKVKSSTVMESR